jgi:hypothetical protein
MGFYLNDYITWVVCQTKGTDFFESSSFEILLCFLLFFLFIFYC